MLHGTILLRHGHLVTNFKICSISTSKHWPMRPTWLSPEHKSEMLLQASHPIDEFKSDSIPQPRPESITRFCTELTIKQSNLNPPNINKCRDRILATLHNLTILMVHLRRCFIATFCCNMVTCFFTLRTQSMPSNLNRYWNLVRDLSLVFDHETPVNPKPPQAAKFQSVAIELWPHSTT